MIITLEGSLCTAFSEHSLHVKMDITTPVVQMKKKWKLREVKGLAAGRHTQMADQGGCPQAHAASTQQLVDPESTALHSFHASALGPSGVLSALQGHCAGKCRLPGGLVLDKGPAETLL